MRLSLNKETKNAGWIIFGKIFQMALSLFIGIFTARYLGPGNYGIINYVAAYTGFFSSFCTLGINSVIIKDFVDHPDEQGKTIGSAICARFISSFLSALSIVSIVAIVDKFDKTIVYVAVLSSLALLFQVFDTLNYWFQSKYNSKISSVAGVLAYIIVSAYKIVLLILKKDIMWFAFATSLDYIVVALALLTAYRKYNGPKLEFSFQKAKSLLKKSYHYILSGMMVAIYGQTDKFMLKHMVSETEVGYYSVATSICTKWVFILSAIIDSLYPTILQLYSENYKKFERKNSQLYAMVFYISAFVSVFITVFAEIAIKIMYGTAYLPAVAPLRITTWYTAFSYIGVARNAWLVCEDKQRYLKYLYAIAVFMNIGINYLLIPKFGASGAALASLFTEILVSLLLPCLIKELRPNVKLILNGIILKPILKRDDD